MGRELELTINLEAVKDTPEYRDANPEQLGSHIIVTTMLAYAKQSNGLQGAERKQYYKIVEDMGKALEKNEKSFVIDDKDFGFLRKCFREAKVVPNGLLKQIEDRILINM